MTSSPDLEHRRLPRILSPFETWGFGLTGLLVWVMAIPVIYSVAGPGSVYVWLPCSILSAIVCLQARVLAKKYPGVSGGLPGYIATLLPNRKLLVTYAGLGYYLGFAASFVAVGHVIIAAVERILAVTITSGETVLFIITLSVIAYSLGFSSTRILSILQNLFSWLSVGIIMLFVSFGTFWLWQNNALGSWQELPAFELGGWIVAMSFALVNILYIEIGVTMMADTAKPKRTADFLIVPASLVLLLFGWGSWVYSRFITGPTSSLLDGLVSAFVTVFGESGDLLALVLVMTASFLTLNAAVVMLPRTLFEMSKHGLVNPLYSRIDRRGILKNGLVATLVLTTILVFLDGIVEFYLYTGAAYVAMYATFHYALWKNRRQEKVIGGSWMALALAVIELGLVLVGGLLVDPVALFIGLSLPIGGMFIDRATYHLPGLINVPKIPLLFSKHNFEYNQVVTTVITIGLSTVISILVLLRVSEIGFYRLLAGEILIFVISAFVATAIASWTTIPQIDSLQEVSGELEKANQELISDIEKRKKLEAKLARNLRRDDLTKLGNRRLLEDHLGLLLKEDREDYALMFLDLDRFKIVNDGLGHVVGDDVLKAVARRLRRVVGRKSSTTIVRLGGDEFVVLFERVQHTKDIMECVQKILEAFEEPLTVGEGKITTTVSAGVVFGERRYDHFEQLLRDADIAMYRSKLNGRNRATVFTDLMRTQAQQTHLMEVALRHALEEKNFVLRYQPIVDSRSNEACGYECLLRMKGGQGELISPDSFVDIAEENGLIVPITWWVLDRALRDLRDWRAAGCECHVSINMSNRTLGQIDLKDRVAEALTKYNLTPDCLNFEVLESAIVNDVSVVQKNLQLLHNFGVKISIDDFGIGYSNLSRLHEMPIDTLKIDRTYVQNLQGHGANIIQTIMDLAQNMGFKVVVEGVEEDREREQLQGMDCAMMQGYLYAKPMPAVDVVEFTRNLPVVPVLERQRR